MNLNDHVYNALRKVPDLTDEQAQRAAGEFARIEAGHHDEFRAMDKRLTRVEIMLGGLYLFALGGFGVTVWWLQHISGLLAALIGK